MAKIAPGTEALSDPTLIAAIAEAIKSMGSSPRKGKKGRKAKSSPELKAQRMAENDAECIRVFTKAGFKDVQPRVNVLTYGKVKPDGSISGWLGQGRKVKAGEKSHKVNGFSLFHIDQTEAIGVDTPTVKAEEAPVAPEAVAEAPAAGVFNWQDQ